ncbi:hypothetical protein OIV83_003264 [Microbotryomycetes sp. JL201]|nr:hypothetical protein OIV83_003264 [Microbotryomycetes sp. JL201]
MQHPPTFHHPPTPQPGDLPLFWPSPAPSTNAPAAPAPIPHTAQQQPVQHHLASYSRPHLKRTHAWSASGRNSSDNQLGLTAITEDEHDSAAATLSPTFNYAPVTGYPPSPASRQDADGHDGDGTRRKRLRIQAPTDEFALLSLAPGSPLSPPSSDQQAKRPLLLSSPPPPPAASLQQLSPPLAAARQWAPPINSTHAASAQGPHPLTAAHLTSLGLDLAQTNHTPPLAATHNPTMPPAPPPSAHSQDEADQAIDEVDMKPSHSSWEIAPNRIYVASLDDSDDESVEKAHGESPATSGTATPTARYQDDGDDMVDDDEDETSRASNRIRVNPVALSAASNTSSLPLPPQLFDHREKQLAKASSLILYKPPSALVAKPLQRLTRDERAQRDDELQEFRRMQQHVEKSHDDVPTHQSDNDTMDLDG